MADQKKKKANDEPKRFRPIADSTAAYEVHGLTTGRYIELKETFLKSSNVDAEHKKQIAEELGVELSEYKNEYNFLQHYEKVCQIIFVKFNGSHDDFEMSQVNAALAFFLAGGGSRRREP